MYEFMQTFAVVMMCILGVVTIIVAIADKTRHWYGWFAYLFNSLGDIIAALSPVLLWVMGLYPIVLLLWYLVSTYSNFGVVITFTH